MNRSRSMKPPTKDMVPVYRIEVEPFDGAVGFAPAIMFSAMPVRFWRLRPLRLHSRPAIFRKVLVRAGGR